MVSAEMQPIDSQKYERVHNDGRRERSSANRILIRFAVNLALYPSVRKTQAIGNADVKIYAASVKKSPISGMIFSGNSHIHYVASMTISLLRICRWSV